MPPHAPPNQQAATAVRYNVKRPRHHIRLPMATATISAMKKQYIIINKQTKEIVCSKARGWKYITQEESSPILFRTSINFRRTEAVFRTSKLLATLFAWRMRIHWCDGWEAINEEDLEQYTKEWTP